MGTCRVGCWSLGEVAAETKRVDRSGESTLGTSDLDDHTSQGESTSQLVILPPNMEMDNLRFVKEHCLPTGAFATSMIVGGRVADFF